MKEVQNYWKLKILIKLQQNINNTSLWMAYLEFFLKECKHISVKWIVTFKGELLITETGSNQ